MSIRNLRYALDYNHHSQRFQFILGGHGVGGAMIIGFARSKEAADLLQRVFNAGLAVRREYGPSTTRSGAAVIAGPAAITNRDLQKCDEVIRRDAEKLLQLIKRSTLSPRDGGYAVPDVVIQDYLNFR